MTAKTKIQDGAEPSIDADGVVRELARIAFANILDFAQFRADGVVHIDFMKAREAGATISLVTRTVGRGKNARQVRPTKIKMPDKTRALILLGKHLGLFKTRQKPK